MVSFLGFALTTWPADTDWMHSNIFRRSHELGYAHTDGVITEAEMQRRRSQFRFENIKHDDEMVRFYKGIPDQVKLN